VLDFPYALLLLFLGELQNISPFGLKRLAQKNTFTGINCCILFSLVVYIGMKDTKDISTLDKD
jgi:MHS family alpha-ketoglutarate permease-like MFS transporter